MNNENKYPELSKAIEKILLKIKDKSKQYNNRIFQRLDNTKSLPQFIEVLVEAFKNSSSDIADSLSINSETFTYNKLYHIHSRYASYMSAFKHYMEGTTKRPYLSTIDDYIYTLPFTDRQKDILHNKVKNEFELSGGFSVETKEALEDGIKQITDNIEDINLFVDDLFEKIKKFNKNISKSQISGYLKRNLTKIGFFKAKKRTKRKKQLDNLSSFDRKIKTIKKLLKKQPEHGDNLPSFNADLRKTGDDYEDFIIKSITNCLPEFPIQDQVCLNNERDEDGKHLKKEKGLLIK